MPQMVATPLIIEDGSIVTGANSFVSVDDAAQFLFDRGLVKQNDIDDADGSGLLRRGLDAIKTLPCLSAYRLPLAVEITIPQPLIEAQIWAAYYIWLGTTAASPLSANDPGSIAQPGVKREQIDTLSVEYKDSQIKSNVSIADMPNVKNALLLMGCTSLSTTSGVIDRA